MRGRRRHINKAWKKVHRKWKSGTVTGTLYELIMKDRILNVYFGHYLRSGKRMNDGNRDEQNTQDERLVREPGVSGTSVQNG